jgi:hypothetical protein
MRLEAEENATSPHLDPKMAQRPRRAPSKKDKGIVFFKMPSALQEIFVDTLKHFGQTALSQYMLGVLAHSNALGLTLLLIKAFVYLKLIFFIILARRSSYLPIFRLENIQSFYHST